MMDNKIKGALNLISETLTKHHNPVISCSFGKDSTVVLWLARQVRQDISVLWDNTLVEFPETYRFAKKLTKEWNLNLVETRPVKGWNFWRVVKTYGFPMGARGGHANFAKYGRAQDKCCHYLKKKPAFDAIKKRKWDVILDGLTVYESKQRWMIIEKYGQYRFNKKWGIHKLSPIAYWSPDDIWSCIETYGIPYNPYYDNELEDTAMTKRGRKRGLYWTALRLGCWSCTMIVPFTYDHLRHLRTFYPRLWRKLMDAGLAERILELKLGGDTLFPDEVIKEITGDWLDIRPCFFDGI